MSGETGGKLTAEERESDALQQALHAVDSTHQFHGEDCLCGFSSARARTRTEHITTAVAELLRQDYLAARADANAAAVARVEALADEMGCSRLHTEIDIQSGQHNVWCNGASWSRATVEERIRAALRPDPSERGGE